MRVAKPNWPGIELDQWPNVASHRPGQSKRQLARSQKSLLLTTSHCVALGKLPVCPKKLRIVMAVTEALSHFLATGNPFMEERKSEGHNTDQFPGDGHEKDSRNSSPSLPVDHWDGTDSGVCV
jgi:hypothetical protein